jgi:hypothetical protein
LLFWDVTQNWFFVNLEDWTNRPSWNVGNQLPTKAMPHPGRVKAHWFSPFFRNLHLPVISQLLVFCCSS